MSPLLAGLNLVSLLVLDNGKRWGEVAQSWQWADVCEILDEASVRYHMLVRARGSSKTTDLAAVLIAVILTRMPDGARLYVLAADRDQGKLVLSAMRGFIVRTPGLKKTLAFSGYRVTVPGRDIVLEVLSADAASSWGLLPDFVVVDELGQWNETSKSKELFEAIRTSVVKKGADLVVITTPSFPQHFAFAVREHARVDEAWRLHEVSGPPPWSDPAALEEQQRALPESSYRRLFGGEWIETDDRLASAAEVQPLVYGPPADPQPGVPYVIAVDLGIVDDPTAAAICHVEAHDREGDKLPVLRPFVDVVRRWAGTKENPVRLAEVRDWLLTEARRYNGARVVIDSWQAFGMVQELKEQGIRAEVVHPTPQLKSQLALGLRTAIREGTLALPDDPPLLRELTCVRLRASSTGHHWIDHDPGEHDDQVFAVSVGVAVALEDARKPGPRFRTLR